MKLTDYVTGRMIERWIRNEAAKVKDPHASATIIFSHMTPELIELSQAIQQWFGVRSKDIGPLLQYLDEAIRFNSEEK